MSQKIVQYLNEAHATEVALVRVLQSQIAMTPTGSYRSAIEGHLRETRNHAERIERRLKELGDSSSPITATIGLVETVLGQVVALSKTPLDLLRGTGGEEKVLKNAKDTAATEALARLEDRYRAAGVCGRELAGGADAAQAGPDDEDVDVLGLL